MPLLQCLIVISLPTPGCHKLRSQSVIFCVQIYWIKDSQRAYFVRPFWATPPSLHVELTVCFHLRASIISRWVSIVSTFWSIVFTKLHGLPLIYCNFANFWATKMCFTHKWGRNNCSQKDGNSCWPLYIARFGPYGVLWWATVGGDYSLVIELSMSMINLFTKERKG